ncbi:MAG TPA: hypothetical protein VJR48_14990 [Ktedonobacterales bacterium]|nr:hypothetical protein [Ktedonobacterales bacterium]
MTPAQTMPRKTSPKRRLTNWVRTQPILAASMLALVLVAIIGGGLAVSRHIGGETAGPPASWAPTTPPPLLPGETLWHGIPSMLWGTNDTQNWDGEKNLITLPAIQKQAKADHLALIRTWLFETDLVTNQPETDAYQKSKVQAALNTGAKLLCELPTGNSMAYDEHMVKLFAGKCSYYEFMNEPDNEQVPAATYISKWSGEIPRLRAIDPHALFGGPAATTPQYSQCTYSSDTTVCYMQKVLQGMALSKVLPDFVTFHWYPCWQESADSCMAKADSYGDQVTLVRGWMTQYFGTAGAHIPIGVTEWNADPSAPMPDYTRDACWIAQYSVTALKSMARAGASFANQFDLANTGGYGSDDMVDVSKNGAAKPQYVALLRLMESVSPYRQLPTPRLAFTPPANCPALP